mmetsp:Transcript_2699/g.4564  ORF Transcript_2699/g.4564 Transcript_2699/m.4564 type:complete len:199 (+) Transcript_2699:2370-2966(+)
MLYTLENINVEELEEFMAKSHSEAALSDEQISENELNLLIQEESQSLDEDSNLNLGSGLRQVVDSSDIDKSTYIDKFRIQISLGSTIQSIDDVSEQGFTINYANGDVCDKKSSLKYSSKIRFECDIGDEADLFEEEKNRINFQREESGGNSGNQALLPQFEKYDPEKCHYEFSWKTKWACSQCKSNQVESIEGRCVAY